MNNIMQVLSQFPTFMQGMRGQDPEAIIKSMLETGRITPEQLEQAKKMAAEMSGQFNQFKGMFSVK